jgi:nitrous oxidase accessory protein NosD
MKKARIILAAILLSGAATGAMAETIPVKPGESIQAALNRAKSGDTVAVHRGTYHESVYAKVSGVKLVSVDGKGAAHIVSGGTPLFIQGGSGNEIRGFALTAGRGGNGLQIGGTISNFAEGYTIADNVIKNAGLDGIKVHQASGFAFTGNVVENAGTGNGGNLDGGIDFVAVKDSRVEGNTVLRTGGNTCLMLKAGTTRNTVKGNSFSGCKDAVHVGGISTDKFMAPGANGREAYENTITGNNLCGRESPVRLFDGERQRQDNVISNNSCSGATVGPTMAGYSPMDAEKIDRDIKTFRGNGLNDSAIQYALGLDGIIVPPEVLSGSKTVQEAIADGSMRQSTPSYSPPVLAPIPKPDSTPKGSSASNWQPNTVLPAIETMRRAIMTTTRPPNC